MSFFNTLRRPAGSISGQGSRSIVRGNGTTPPTGVFLESDIRSANQVRMSPSLNAEQRQQMIRDVSELWSGIDWAAVPPVDAPDIAPDFNRPRRLISLQDE